MIVMMIVMVMVMVMVMMQGERRKMRRREKGISRGVDADADLSHRHLKRSERAFSGGCIGTWKCVSGKIMLARQEYAVTRGSVGVIRSYSPALLPLSLPSV
jgi:hypothetical protein